MPQGKGNDEAQNEHEHRAGHEKPGAVSIWVKDQAWEGMHQIEEVLRERWELVYDRPELLRLITQITIQLVELGLVVRVGLHFALNVPPAAHPHQHGGTQRKLTKSGRTRGHAVWVGGVTMAGLHWLHDWLQEDGYEANRSDVLELAVDLSLQALDAGLVSQPKGPQVTVRPSSQQ